MCVLTMTLCMHIVVCIDRACDQWGVIASKIKSTVLTLVWLAPSVCVCVCNSGCMGVPTSV